MAATQRKTRPIGRRAAPAAKPRRRTQQERRETTRRQLLDAAIECIHEMGFGGATLSIIADRAGVTRGAVQHHFGARNDLFLALIAEISDELFAHSDAKSLGGKPIRDRIAAICDQYWQIISSRHYIAAVQIQLGTMHDPELYPQVYKVLRKAETRLDSRWVELFADQNLAPARIMVARHVVVATLRGLAIRQVHRRATDGWEAERALLQDMVARALAG